MRRPGSKQLLGKHKTGTKRRREETVQELTKERATPTRATEHAGCLSKALKCTYDKDCKFKHEAGTDKGASVRQLSVEASENSTKITLPMAGHEDEGWSIARPHRTYKNALYRAARALEAPERSSTVTCIKA